MDNVPHIIHQDIIIMSILNLEDILIQTITSQAAGEISDCCLPIITINLLINCAK